MRYQSRRDLIAAAPAMIPAQPNFAATQALIEALADGMVDDPATEERYLHSSAAALNRSLEPTGRHLFELAQIDAGVTTCDARTGLLHDLLSDTTRRASNRKP